MTLYKALVFVLLVGQLAWSIPANAAGPQMWVHLRIYVYNSKDGSPIPGQIVDFDQNRTAACPTGASKSAETGSDGVAEMYVYACVSPDSADVTVSEGIHEAGRALFSGHRFVTITRGVTNYEVRLATSVREDNPNYNSNKYLNQDRVLHIRVVGKVGKQLLPVHYAEIFDQQGKRIAVTNWQGTATVKHKEVVGETVTLRAVPENMPANWKEGWEPASASFIVGASEGTVRTTIPEDHITIVLNGNNSNVEKHPLDVKVLGSKPERTNVRCRCVRVAGARILDEQGHLLGVTDSAGRATVTVEVPLGEEYTVKAEAKHWIAASERLQSGSSGQAGVLGISTYAHEHVDFMLQPNTSERESLTVEVLDRETDKPIGGAAVTLYKPDRFPGTEVATTDTDAEGNGTFDAEEADRATLNSEARVGVKHSNYEPAVQTVSAGSGHYIVFLKEKKETGNAALTAEGPTLAGVTPRGWVMTTSNASYTYRSRPQSQKDTVMKASWRIPTSIPASGAKGSMTVSVEGGDLDGISLGIGVGSDDNSGLIRCAGIKNAGGSSGCLDGDHASAQVSANINESKSATQEFWIKPNGRGGTIVINLPLGKRVVYVFKVAGGKR